MEPAAAVSLSSGELLKLALSTGAVAAVMAPIATQIVDSLIDRSKSKKAAEVEATHLAARLAVVLEKYAIKCALQIADNNLHRQTGEHAGQSHTTLPELGEFPSQADWTKLDPKLWSRSSSLPNQHLLGESAIEFQWDIDPDPAQLRSACDGQAGLTGYRAWQVAEDLRNKYGLPKFDPKEFSWDIVTTLKKDHDREIERIKEHQKTQEAQ